MQIPVAKDFSKVCPICGGPLMYMMEYLTSGPKEKEVCMNKETVGCPSG
jgi:C4-type Zn-finger protein